MNSTALHTGPLNRTISLLRLLFQRPARTQIAALCYRSRMGAPEVLLITSRNAKRWIIPKGWPMAELTARKTAKREAFEEAGIIGKIGKQPIGEFTSHKGVGNGLKVRTNIIVYPLLVENQTNDFPENGQRELAWLRLDQAIERCQDRGLRKMLQTDIVKSLLMDAK